MSSQLIGIIVLVLLAVCALLWIERCKMSSRELVLVGVLSGLAGLSRVPFAGLPSVQPTTFIVIMCGAVFGSAVGLSVGVVATLVSNTFLGHGTWTICQMIAWGLCGASAGWFLRIYPHAGRVALTVFCFIWGYVFGWLMNMWHWYTFVYPLTFKTWVATNAMSFWFDSTHAVVNASLCFVCGDVIVRIFRRYKAKLRS